MCPSSPVDMEDVGVLVCMSWIELARQVRGGRAGSAGEVWGRVGTAGEGGEGWLGR